MEGYLLDTNVLIPLIRPGRAAGKSVRRRLAEVATESPVFVSVAALAELHVGPIWRGGNADQSRYEIEATIADSGLKVREITRHTAAVYGDLKARLMLKYNRGGERNAAKWPEGWPLPDTGKTLGVDEFDLLMVAHALEYRLVLVTNDQMRRIRDGLGEVADELRFEDWTAAAPGKETP